MTTAPKLTEAQVTDQCIEMLEWGGWLCKRQHVGTFQSVGGGKRHVSMGERGDPDYEVSRRYDPSTVGVNIQKFYIEFKAPGKKPRPDQLAMHALLSSLGFEVCVCHGIDELRAWMGERGLL